MDCHGWSINHQLTMSDVSSMLSLLVSGLALYFAVRAGRTVMNDWRSQRQLDAKAQAAEEALAAVFALTDAFTIRSIAEDPKTLTRDLAAKGTVNRRLQWRRLDSHWERLTMARVRVEAYIPQESSVLSDLVEFGTNLLIAQDDLSDAAISDQEFEVKKYEVLGIRHWAN